MEEEIVKTTEPKFVFFSRGGLHGVVSTGIKNGRISLSFDDSRTQDIQCM